MKLLAATGNKDKLIEIRRILSPLGVEVLSPQEAGISSEVEETGTTFAENAFIKAKELYKRSGMPAVADDSGLCVDALGGRPGVYSARYLGDSPQSEKNAALLSELCDISTKDRTARFVCAICCVIDNNTTLTAAGICEGDIAFEPSGLGGFGYDPIFLAGGRSFAELTPDEKDEVSHRGKALREFSRKLGAYMRTNSIAGG